MGFLPSVVVMLASGWKLHRSSRTEPADSQTPILPLLPYVLLASSMSFFLFSFQVHEKTILVPLLPITLLLSGSAADTAVFGWGVLINNVAVFSMWPLLKRDGLLLQYIALVVLWNRLIGYNPFKLPKLSFVQIVSLVSTLQPTTIISLTYALTGRELMPPP